MRLYCHIFAARTRVAAPNITVFYCQHLSAFGDRTPKFGTKESIFVRTGLKGPRCFFRTRGEAHRQF